MNICKAHKVSARLHLYVVVSGSTLTIIRRI